MCLESWTLFTPLIRTDRQHLALISWWWSSYWAALREEQPDVLSAVSALRGCVDFLFLLILSMKLLGLLAAVFLLSADRRVWSSHPKPACRYPPSQWCRSLEIAIECRVSRQCLFQFKVSLKKNAPITKRILVQEANHLDVNVYIYFSWIGPTRCWKWLGRGYWFKPGSSHIYFHQF